MNNDSVTEQSGIFAGDGGFDITAGGHTQLDGAVIASTGPADKNSLDTGTLGFSDTGNKAASATPKAGQTPCFGFKTDQRSSDKYILRR
ncbi:putative heme utilization/adhesion exoprotein [Rahnella aquatilis CIP 78.65 = ATCC 33071]|nr:hypothetical protein [Rahnella aquatilis]KFD00402.1 putative heme utilization/adhesion exoprotein [Rahnella aquatilis CIP 78.65 = ATCC 33071]